MAASPAETLLRRVEGIFERLLFASRWIAAPIYIGLAVALLLVLAKFVVMVVDLVRGFAGSLDHLIVGILGLVDLSLVANLVLMVMLAGYENFVSRFDLGDHPDRPGWMGRIGFGEIKLKLLASIVAIAAIHVLEDFMNTATLADRDLAWRAGLLLLFVVSGILLALMDRVGGGGEHGH